MKEELRKAFKAGKLNEASCKCGECPLVPDFEDWFKNNTAAPVKTLQECTKREFEDLALKAYCKHSEVEGFIFTTYQGRSSQDKSNGYCSGFQNGYKQALIDQPKAPVKVVTDEDIQNYVTAAHPDTIGNKPLQILMREKIRISLEWMRKQLTGE